MDISTISNTELQRLIGRYMQGWQVSWSTYSRDKVVEILQTNSYIYAIINKIARASRSVNLMVGKLVDDTFEEDKKNVLHSIINYPNVLMTRKDLIEQAAIHYMAFGEAFITFDTYEGGNNKGQIIPGTIQLIPPQIVDIKHINYIPVAYIITGQIESTIPVDRVLHIKNYNPDYKDLHGLSPIQVALSLIDKLNAANTTETLTFQKGGPAYLVSPKAVDSVSDAQEFKGFMGMLRSIWKREQKGVAGVNIPIDVATLGQSPADLGTIESQRNTMKVLLTVWGLDAGLFDTEASTFNNKQVMDRAVYSEAAIPMVEKLIDKINGRFAKYYDAIIVTDTSAIEVLQPNFKEKAEWMTLANVFSENEIREAVGYKSVENETSNFTPAENFNSTALAGFSNLDKDVVQRET
jgi:HK97 family phage portal protein